MEMRSAATAQTTEPTNMIIITIETVNGDECSNVLFALLLGNAASGTRSGNTETIRFDAGELTAMAFTGMSPKGDSASATFGFHDTSLYGERFRLFNPRPCAHRACHTVNGDNYRKSCLTVDGDH